MLGITRNATLKCSMHLAACGPYSSRSFENSEEQTDDQLIAMSQATHSEQEPAFAKITVTDPDKDTHEHIVCEYCYAVMTGKTLV